MSQTLTYVMGADRRVHVKDIQDFKIDFSDDNHNWVQARQFERGMRQVFVNIINEDGTPFDLTGCNVWFEGLLPKTADGDFRVIDDDGYVPLDPSAGKFRYDMPGQAFTVAGSYRQAFFRILKNNNSVTTLEFDLDVLADKVIDGLVPKDWVGPFDEIAGQLVDSLQKHTDDADKILADFQKKVGDLIAQLNQQGSTTTSMLTELQNRIADLEDKIKRDDLVTQQQLDTFKQAMTNLIKTQTINVFDSVDDMKHNASSLSEGMKVRTIAYYSGQDEKYGGCLYEIKKDKTNLPAIDFENGLYAVPVLEHNRTMNAACFGIHVNSEDDQADAIQTFLNAVPYNYKAYFPAGSYVLGHGIKLPGNRELFGDTTNILNAGWNGTGFFFKNLAPNTIAIDAHDGGKQTVHNIWVEIDGAYSFSVDRSKAKTSSDNSLVSPFTHSKTIDGIVGVYVGGYGSIIRDSVVSGASEVAIDSDAFCQIRNNQIWNSCTGIRTKSDMQVNGNRIQLCEFGLELDGAECNVYGERYDSISEMGFVLKRADGSNLVNVQIDYCGGPGILLNNSSNCRISTQVGRTGVYYAGAQTDDLSSPTFAAGVALTGTSSYNDIDIAQDYAGIFDSGTPDVKAPRYKVVVGQYYDAADTHAYHNDIRISGGGFDIQPGEKLTVDQLKRFLYIAGAASHVVYSGSMTVYGTTYYYNNVDSTYSAELIGRDATIGYNDEPATTLSTLTFKKIIYNDDVISKDLNSLTTTGIYGWNGFALTASDNVPPQKDTGFLLVINTDSVISQVVIGYKAVQSRVYTGTSWSAWKQATLS